jgi:hypothetical protein
MRFAGSNDQSAKHHRGGACVVQGGVGRQHLQAELLHQASQPGGLALGQFEHQPGQCRGVDDRMLERAFEPPTHQPAVERIVAVLDQDGALGKAQERPARIPEFGGPDQHRTLDVVPLAGVRIDRRATVDERVEESKRARQLEALGAKLED